MLQDIAPHAYAVEFKEKSPKEGDRLLCYAGGRLLAKGGEELDFPCVTDLPEAMESSRYLFSIDGTAYFLYQGDALSEQPGLCWRELSDLRAATPMWRVFAAMTGAHLYRWYDSHRFCGRCGRPLAHSHTERALVCRDCGITLYPQIAPALIIAVTDGDKLLLTRYADRPYKRFALIAGYNEIGESLEDTLRREVREEVGLKVANFRYYKSQPWPFTDTLLMGFYCDVEGEREARPDGQELAEARWFSRSELPADERQSVSLTQEMIEVFRQGREPR
ncbi:MAG: NAD(+) diphosphatase [Firmicutes bacterium]|nr:NAD(+) diphosphatase [Bacillota bacterium]